MSAGKPRPARPRRRWIWVIVAVLTAVVLVTPPALRVALKQDLHHEFARLGLYRHPVTAVQVSAPGNAVAVTVGEPGQVSVSGELSWLFSRPVVRHAWHGTTLAISVRCPSPNLFEDCSAGLTLHVPAAVAVAVSVGPGSAAVAGVAGPVRADATSGSLTLAYLSGPVLASVTSGSIRAVTGLTSRRLTAGVSSGYLLLGFDRAPQSLSLAIGSGSGKVTVPPASRYRITAGASAAAVHVAPGLASPGAADLISVELGSGGLAIGYPGVGGAGS